MYNSAVDRENFAHALEAICNCPKVGYSQSDRMSLWNECEKIGWNLSKINQINPCNCDCSSLMAVCARFAGVNVNRYIWTGNLEAALKATGKVTVYKQSRYLTSDKYIQRGGILLNTQHHVAGVLSTGAGVTANGTTGSTTAAASSTILKVHDTGNAVKKMQTMLIACGYSCGASGADEIFGTGTYSALCLFQKQHGLAVDGQYGPKSRAALETAYNVATEHKSVDTVAREVIAGEWGTGKARTDKLEAAGYDAEQVQHRVNELMGIG